MSLESIFRRIAKKEEQKAKDRRAVQLFLDKYDSEPEQPVKVTQKRTTSRHGGLASRSTLGLKVRRYGG